MDNSKPIHVPFHLHGAGYEADYDRYLAIKTRMRGGEHVPDTDYKFVRGHDQKERVMNRHHPGLSAIFATDNVAKGWQGIRSSRTRTHRWNTP